MTNEQKEFIKDCVKHYNKWCGKLVDVRDINNLPDNEYKIEALARIKAVDLANKFVKSLVPKDLRDIKPEIEFDLSDLYIDKSDTQASK